MLKGTILDLSKGSRDSIGSSGISLEPSTGTHSNFSAPALTITFRHPGSGKEIILRADVPDFMQSVIKFLEFKLP